MRDKQQTGASFRTKDLQRCWTGRKLRPLLLLSLFFLHQPGTGKSTNHTNNVSEIFFFFFLRSLYLQQKGFWWGQQTLLTLFVIYESAVGHQYVLCGKEEEKTNKQTNIYIHLGLEDHDVPRHVSTGTDSVQVRRVHACPLPFNNNILLTQCLRFDQGNQIRRVKMCVSVLHYFYCRDPETSGVKNYRFCHYHLPQAVISCAAQPKQSAGWHCFLFPLRSLFNFPTAVCVYVLWWDINVILWAR